MVKIDIFRTCFFFYFYCFWVANKIVIKIFKSYMLQSKITWTKSTWRNIDLLWNKKVLKNNVLKHKNKVALK